MPTRHFIFALPVLLSIVLGLSACTSDANPEQAILDYLAARVLGDARLMQQFVCADWEAQVQIEASSFAGRNARLDNVQCSVAQQSADEGVIACSGQIVAVYDGEDNTFPIGDYRVVREDGAWKMCGEAP
jgi:hypothetical protein